jgi:hypothetical protein
MRSDHQRLLAAAGFHDILEFDVTSAFAVTAAAWLVETEPHVQELARLEPPGAFEQRQADRRRMLAAIHAGLLRRTLLLARTTRSERTARGFTAQSPRRRPQQAPSPTSGYSSDGESNEVSRPCSWRR